MARPDGAGPEGGRARNAARQPGPGAPLRSQIRHAVVVSPDVSNAPAASSGCACCWREVLEHRGGAATIVGPHREVTRWPFRLGVELRGASSLAARALRAGSVRTLLITNGYMGAGYGASSLAGVPRIHVYHGTAVGAIRAAGDRSPRRERTRHLVGDAAALRRSRYVGRRRWSASRARLLGEARRFYRVGARRRLSPTGSTPPSSRPEPRERHAADWDSRDDGRYALFVGRMDYGKGARLMPAGVRARRFRAAWWQVATQAPMRSTWASSPPERWPSPTPPSTACSSPACMRRAASSCSRRSPAACPDHDARRLDADFLAAVPGVRRAVRGARRSSISSTVCAAWLTSTQRG